MSDIPVIDAVKTISQYRHKKTGAIYKSVEDAESFGIKKEDLQQDFHVTLPKLDLFAKTK